MEKLEAVEDIEFIIDREREIIVMKFYSDDMVVNEQAITIKAFRSIPFLAKMANVGWDNPEKVVEVSEMTRRAIRPRSCTLGELRCCGLILLRVAPVGLRCMKCGTEWSPNQRRGGRMPAG